MQSGVKASTLSYPASLTQFCLQAHLDIDPDGAIVPIVHVFFSWTTLMKHSVVMPMILPFSLSFCGINLDRMLKP